MPAIIGRQPMARGLLTRPGLPTPTRATAVPPQRSPYCAAPSTWQASPRRGPLSDGADYTAGPVPTTAEPGATAAAMRGSEAVLHVRLLGLRADEPSVSTACCLVPCLRRALVPRPAL